MVVAGVLKAWHNRPLVSSRIKDRYKVNGTISVSPAAAYENEANLVSSYSEKTRFSLKFLQLGHFSTFIINYL